MATTASFSLWEKAAAEQKKQLCMQKRWKFTKKNGHVIIIRDVCEKIIKWIRKFKETGDVAVQYDPSHASLPWAAVRFFLQLSVNDVQTFGAMAEGLETVACHITRCKTYENFYLSRSSSARADLEYHLLRHYAVILTYLATARRYYTKSTVRRLGTSVFETSDSVDACLPNIAAGRDEVERCARLIDSELFRGIDGAVSHTQVSINAIAGDLRSVSTSQDSQYLSLKDIMSSFEQPILRAAAQVSDIHTSLAKKERRKILAWLSSVQYREHHKTSYNAVMPGSGAWLQKKPEFVDWKSSSVSSILWIHGIPGSGKSKLMSIVIQDILEAKVQNTSTSAFSYFYCTRDEAEKARANPDEIMRAILKQLSCSDASQPIHAAVLREYQKRRKDADVDGLDPSNLSFHDCKNLILEISDQLPIVVMVDALDECNPLRRHELLQALGGIVQTSNSLVKVIISSREDLDISCRLVCVPNVYIISDDSRDDLDRFVEQELDKAIEEQRLLRGQVPSCLRQQIIERLRAGANGMFLWAHLQIQNLCDPERMIVASDVEDALQRLPTTLIALYSSILDRIDRIAPHGRLLATKTLSWILCARRPLDPVILTQMLQPSGSGNPFDAQDILGLCCNLVVLDNSLNVFRFAHASVREFLESQPRFSYQKINFDAAKECVRVIIKAPGPSHAQFNGYALRFWMEHYLDEVILDDELKMRVSGVIVPHTWEVKTFFVRRVRGNNRSAHWVKLGEIKGNKGEFQQFIPSKKLNTTLRRLTFGPDLLKLIEALFECRKVKFSCDKTGNRNIFTIFICRGHEKLVKVFLTQDITEPQVTGSFHKEEIGHEAIALLLMQRDPNTNVHHWRKDLKSASSQSHYTAANRMMELDLPEAFAIELNTHPY